MMLVEEKPIHKLWWLWVPFIGMVIQFILESTLSPGALSHMHSENGPHEAIEFLILVGAFFVSVRCLSLINWKEQRWLGYWFALAAVCCFYVAGEEISWGQHILKWSTPEYWTHFNDQQETNLHNTSSWLDQKPRLILELGVITGGLIIPFLKRFKPSWLPARFAVIYPPAILAVTAGVFLFLKLADKASDFLEENLFERVSELQELCLFYFVLLYLVSLKRRVFPKIPV